MKVQLHDILAVPTELAYAEPVVELNAMLHGGKWHDYDDEREPVDDRLGE